MSHMPDSELEVPTIGLGIYQHYKGEKYEVIGVGLDTETLAPLVIYKPLYQSKVPYWIRPLAIFLETVEASGTKIPRFKKL